MSSALFIVTASLQCVAALTLGRCAGVQGMGKQRCVCLALLPSFRRISASPAFEALHDLVSLLLCSCSPTRLEQAMEAGWVKV